MIGSVSKYSSAAFRYQLSKRHRGALFVFIGAFAAMLAVYLSPQFPGPSPRFGAVLLWVVLSLMLSLIPAISGFFIPEWSRKRALVLGALLGYAVMQGALYWTKYLGPKDSLLFRWLYFG